MSDAPPAAAACSDGTAKTGAWGPLESALAALPSLYEVDLKGAGLDGADVARLVHALAEPEQPLRLTSVSLANNALPDSTACLISEALLQAASCRGLRYVDLSWNRINQECAGRLANGLRAGGGSLVSLDLECNDLQDAGTSLLAAALPATRSLRHLALGGNRIGAPGAAALAAALPRCGLEGLDVGRNRLGPRGAASIADALREPLRGPGPGLRALRLPVNRISDAGAAALAAALGDARGLALSLETLDVANNLIGDEGAGAFARALSSPSGTSLTFLGLARNRLGPKGAEALAEAADAGRCQLLQTLELYGNDDVGATVLGRIALSLRRNCRSIVPYDPLQAAVDLCRSGIYCIELNGVQVGPDGARRLADALVGKKVRVCELRLSNAGLGDDGLPTSLWRRAPEPFEEPMAWAQGTPRLDLSWNRITAKGAEAIAEALQSPQGCPLQELCLDCNDVRDAGAAALARALEARRPDGSPCGQLKTLKLPANGIGTSGAKSLADALCSGVAGLEHLDLGRNRLGPAGAAEIARALASAESPLRSLALAVNRLGDAGAEALARGLAARPACAAHVGLTLGLRSNVIGDAGAAALASALAGCGGLVAAVDLGHNRVGRPGADALAAAVEARKQASPDGSPGFALSMEGNPAEVAPAKEPP